MVSALAGVVWIPTENWHGVCVGRHGVDTYREPAWRLCWSTWCGYLLSTGMASALVGMVWIPTEHWHGVCTGRHGVDTY